MIGNKWRGYFLTAYGIAVKHGFMGTEEEWLLSLTSYGIALKLGFEGTQEEWIASLKGEKGDRGEPFKYEDFTEEQLALLKEGAIAAFISETEALAERAEAAVGEVENISAEVEKDAEAARESASFAENVRRDVSGYHDGARGFADSASSWAGVAEKHKEAAEEAAERAVEAANEAAKLNSIIEELEINSEVIKYISTLGSIEKLDNDPEIADTTELLAFKVFCENKSVWRVLFALYTGEDKTPANTFFVDDDGDILTDENNAIITDEEGV